MRSASFSFQRACAEYQQLCTKQVFNRNDSPIEFLLDPNCCLQMVGILNPGSTEGNEVRRWMQSCMGCIWLVAPLSLRPFGVNFWPSVERMWDQSPIEAIEFEESCLVCLAMDRSDEIKNLVPELATRFWSASSDRALTPRLLLRRQVLLSVLINLGINVKIEIKSNSSAINNGSDVSKCSTPLKLIGLSVIFVGIILMLL